jgi:hypothetical protein
LKQNRSQGLLFFNSNFDPADIGHFEIDNDHFTIFWPEPTLRR